MQRIDSIVLKETKYIAVFIIFLSVIMQIVFALLGYWDFTVLTGNLLAAAAAIFNFLWMGITVQKALAKDEKDARTAMKASQALRTLFLFVILAIGVLLDFFNTIAVIVPLFFPRIAVAMRPMFDRKMGS
ncbi:MAG: hypothetical protein IJP24_05130 [Firmicutes bacterium]|nr:hypothetical protein [Clostridiales bacterium]MBQ9972890.1 hypothetical protein [Bacillota bacterium]